MTNRDFYKAVIEANISDEMTEKANALIESLDKANAKRQAKKTEGQAEVDKVVLGVLTTEKVKASAIAEGLEYSTSKVVASLKRLEAEGKVVITKEEKGSRNISWYALAE
jgi:DNA-binding transcriptional regulator GbsR (MarR family)